MSKSEELANMLDDLYAVDERPIDKETSTELRRLSAINSELLEALKSVKSNLMHQRRFGVDDMGSWKRAATGAEADIEDAIGRAAIAKAQGEQP